jgi:hypothetical protein
VVVFIWQCWWGYRRRWGWGKGLHDRSD